MTLIDIIGAVTQALTDGFPDFSLYEGALPQDFSKPCFLVQIASVTKTNETAYRFSKAITVAVRYYPDGGAGSGLPEMQDRLEALFDMALQVGDRVIGLDNTTGEFVDGVLCFTFELSYTDGREDTSGSYELMQRLEMKEEF